MLCPIDSSASSAYNNTESIMRETKGAWTMAKIFYRERNRFGAGTNQPRFAVVGVQGSDMTFFQFHLRKGELEAIAAAVGAELVELPRGKGDHLGSAGGGGKRKTGRGGKTVRRRTSSK
jgi:hypothetical protein